MKALVVGLGGVGQRHVRNLRTLVGDSLEILAFRSRRLSRTIDDRLGVEPGVDVEVRWGIRAFERLVDALAESPTFAVISNPTSLHMQPALAAARAGCHLFLEKPVSDGLAGTDELLAIQRETNRVMAVGYQLRFHPLLERLQAIVREGLVGRIVSVGCEIGEYMPGWHPYEDYQSLYASRRDLGGGVLLTQIHEFDYLYSLFGAPSRVFAVGGHLTDLEIDVEDVVDVQMEFAVAGRGIPAHVHLDYLQRPPVRRCTVVGEAGKAQLDFTIPRLLRFGREGDVVEDAQPSGFERNSMFLAEMKDFLERIRSGGTPRVTLESGLQSLRMALAARESMRTGAVVSPADLLEPSEKPCTPQNGGAA
jgi:predicted dehydrogenase